MAYTTWVHGVAGVCQTPSDQEGRYGDGLHLRSRPGKQWVHFPVPTFSARNDGRVKTLDVLLKASLNENARLVAVHVWSGNYRVDKWEPIDVRGPNVDLTWNMKDKWVSMGLGVHVLVEYMSGEPIGHVTFHSVGMKLE